MFFGINQQWSHGEFTWNSIFHTLFTSSHIAWWSKKAAGKEAQKIWKLLCATHDSRCAWSFSWKTFISVCDALLLGIWCEGETVFDLFPRFSLVNKNKVNHRVRHKVCQYALLQNTIECEQVLSCPPTLCGHLWNLKLQPAKQSYKPKRFLFIENPLLARPARKINLTANSTYIYDLF